MNRFAAGLACGLIGGVALSGGVALAAADVDVTYRKLRVLAQVLTYIQASYVDDVDGMHERLVSLGYEARSATPRAITSGPNEGARSVYMQDPDGYAVEALNPSEYRAAALAALGIYPFTVESFAVGDLQTATSEVDGLRFLNEYVLGRVP